MKFKYYDVLSTHITGVVLFFVFLYAFEFEKILEMNDIFLLGLAYMIGYILNAISAILEKFYFWTMGGKPSDILLTPKQSGKPVGYGRIKFHECEKVVKLLKEEIGNSNATQGQMFGTAMNYSNSNYETRVPEFNARYAFSRVFLTLVILGTILLAFSLYNLWWFWTISVLILVLSWNRCKENGYYYVREVLNEYLKLKKN